MKPLQEECKTIQEFLEITTSGDPDELVARLTDLNVYMARTGQMLAEAQLLRDTVIAGVYAEHSKTIINMPATIARKFVETQCTAENYLVTWVERMNKTCAHQSDNIRTQISFAKEQLSLTRRGY